MLSIFTPLWSWLTGTFAGKIAASMLVSLLPVIELRGGVPIAVGLGLSPAVALPVCAIANMIPIVPVMVCIQHLLRWARHHGTLMQRFACWLENRVNRHRHILDRYAWLGLVILTAIPFPGTGAWTSSMLAGLTGVRIRYALPAISLGVVIAGVIMSVLSYGVASAI